MSTYCPDLALSTNFCGNGAVDGDRLTLTQAKLLVIGTRVRQETQMAATEQQTPDMIT